MFVSGCSKPELAAAGLGPEFAAEEAVVAAVGVVVAGVASEAAFPGLHQGPSLGPSLGPKSGPSLGLDLRDARAPGEGVVALLPTGGALAAVQPVEAAAVAARPDAGVVAALAVLLVFLDGFGCCSQPGRAGAQRTVFDSETDAVAAGQRGEATAARAHLTAIFLWSRFLWLLNFDI